MREYLTLDQLKQFSFEKIERLQNIRFSATCKHLLPYTQFYSELFKKYGADPHSITNVQDWHKLGLPLIKKSAYLKNPQSFIVKPEQKGIFKKHLTYLEDAGENREAIELFFSKDKEKQIKNYYMPQSLIFSGGTESGNPAPVLLTRTQNETLNEILKIAGELLIKKYLPNERLIGMNLFPYAPHLGWHAVHRALDINCDTNLNTAAGGAVPTERLVSIAIQAKPNVICGMNDYLRNRFLPMMIERKAKLPERVIFVNGAQKMLQAERERIEQFAKKCGVREAIVIDLYAASELKEAILPELSPRSGFYHLAPLSTIIKTVQVNSADKDFVTEWEFSDNGYGATWNIDGAGTLFEGYLLGDVYKKVENTQCPQTGLNVTRIHEVNRIRDVEAALKVTGIVEEKVKGTKVNLVAVRERALEVSEVDEAQVILRKNKIELRYTSKSPAKAKQKLAKVFKEAEIKPTLKYVKEFGQEGVKFNTVKIE